jgi:hypothetical protein
MLRCMSPDACRERFLTCAEPLERHGALLPAANVDVDLFDRQRGKTMRDSLALGIKGPGQAARSAACSSPLRRCSSAISLASTARCRLPQQQFR